jgi:hypothetical protein
MKRTFLIAIVVAMTGISVPYRAHAAQTTVSGATVCGRVSAPAEVIQDVIHPNILLAFPAANIIVARSSSEEVEGKVGLDGTYCFHNLHTDMHTISAFGDESLGDYTARVLPVAGSTIYADLTAPTTI